MITTALHFSGGKDSRAILHMHRDRLDEILVVWANAGAPYPGVLEEMQALGATLPHFLIVNGDQPAQHERAGFPVDVLPISYSPIGRHLVKTAQPYRLQSAFDCCAQNLWEPMHRAMVERKITTIIRGQRRGEDYSNSFVTHGSVINGVRYLLPLEDWSADQVMDYLRDNDVPVPAHYDSESTSRDCWNCTAYLSENQERIAHLPAPMRAQVHERLRVISSAIEEQTAPLRAALERAAHGH